MGNHKTNARTLMKRLFKCATCGCPSSCYYKGAFTPSEAHRSGQTDFRSCEAASARGCSDRSRCLLPAPPRARGNPPIHDGRAPYCGTTRYCVRASRALIGCGQLFRPEKVGPGAFPRSGRGFSALAYNPRPPFGSASPLSESALGANMP